MFKYKKLKFKIFNNPKILTILGFFVIIAISYPLSKNISQQYRINREISDLKKEIEARQNKNGDLDKLMGFLESDQFIDKQARLNLNYKKAGENVVVIKNKENLAGVPDQDSSENMDNSDPGNSSLKQNKKQELNMARWWNYFIK